VALSGDGTLLLLEADYIGEGTSPLTWSAFTFNEGSPAANLTDGAVSVSPSMPPIANDDVATTDEDTPITIDVLSNDTDPDGDALSVTAATDPAHGTTLVNGDGTITYTPDTNYNGTDTFDYTVSDGNGGTDNGTVNVTINAVNDAPAFSESQVFVSPTDGASVVIGGSSDLDPESPSSLLEVEWNSATDPDGDETTYSWQLSDLEDFSSMLLPNDSINTNVDTSNGFKVEYGTLATILSDDGVGLFESATLYHRVVATDGKLNTVSNTAQFTLTRGTLVANETTDEIPDTYTLSPNYPNPFRSSTTFRFALPQSNHVRIDIYNVLGRRVATLADGRYPAGWHAIRWNTSGLVSGLYFVQMTGDGFRVTQTATVLR